MRRASLYIAASMLALLMLAACGKPIVLWPGHPENYRHHKNTPFLKVHWNILHPDKGTAVAEGYVEPFSHDDEIYMVNLRLVGLDEDGKIISKAGGRPKDNLIVSPVDASPFRIILPLSGKETDFTIIGIYYHFKAGEPVSLNPQALDTIPLEADEPL